MQDAWRSYVELALGLSEASRKKAMKVAKKLGKRSGATVEQLQAIAEDLTETSAANREALVKLIRYELDRALGAVGLATVDEVSELTDRIRDLEGKLRDAETRAASRAPAKKTTAKQTAAKKTTAKKATAKKTTAKKTAAKAGGASRTTKTASKAANARAAKAVKKALPPGTGS